MAGAHDTCCYLLPNLKSINMSALNFAFAYLVFFFGKRMLKLPETEAPEPRRSPEPHPAPLLLVECQRRGVVQNCPPFVA